MKLLRLARTATPPAPKLSVALTYAERQRYRLRKAIDADTEIAIVLERGQPLRPGEVLVAEDGTGVRIKSDIEELMEVPTNDPLALARAAYHLGNRHVAVEIGEDGVRFPADAVLGRMIEGLGLPLGTVWAPFRPESGAYGQAGSHGHDHDHDHDHDHGHAHDHDHGHEHDHGHAHAHGHDHDHAHCDHDHAHDHGDGHAHGHGHGHGHDHGHAHGHEHSRAHDHGHRHAHDHGHDHAHDQDHDHDHAAEPAPADKHANRLTQPTPFAYPPKIHDFGEKK